MGEDFTKHKIVYPETTQGAYFAYDEQGVYIDKTCFMIITKFPKWLQTTLSSRLFEYAYRRIFSSIELGEHAYQYNKHALVKLPIIYPVIDKELSEEEVFCIYGISAEEQENIINSDSQ